MPLVFVHGVNTRRGDTPEENRVFDRGVALMMEQFAKTTFAERVTAQDGLRTFAPYWGDLGVGFARNLASLPQSGVQALSVGQPASAAVASAVAAKLDGDLLHEDGLASAPLVTLAKTRSLIAAVDLLFAAAANAPVSALMAEATTAALPDLAQFAGAAEAYAQQNPQPAWLPAIDNDGDFLDRLISEVTKPASEAEGATPTVSPGIQALGIGDSLKTLLSNGAKAAKNAVQSVLGGVGHAAGQVGTSAARAAFGELSKFLRPRASAFLGRFVGDVFVYLENRQQIIDRVMDVVREAVKAKRPGDSELYLVGHSFGGIILYDILTALAGEPALACDLYVTVGSQVALFAEIGRLADKADITAAFAKGRDATVPRPPNAARWLNVFDPTDYFGFGTRGVFSGAHDFEFDTDALPLVSHAAYFDTPRFFARLEERAREAFANGTDGR